VRKKTGKEKLYQQRYYNKNKEKIHAKHRQWWKEWYAINKQEVVAKIRNKRWALKQEVLTHYGNGKCICIKCGFNDIRALTIDHINGEGHIERKQLGKGLDRGGVPFYRWLKRNGYPQGYQTLCMNCQVIKEIKKPVDLL